MAFLEVKRISKNFAGIVAVSDLSFDVEEREIVGLIGPNGAGKTTVFNVITGFYMPENGNITFQGQELIGLKPNQICKMGLGRTFQIVKPFPDISTFRNVRVGVFNHVRDVKLATKETERILEEIGLITKRDQLAGNLTIPDRKRLELARALGTKPKLLLLDEVMAGLTPREVEDFVGLIKKISLSGVTILMIEHVMRGVMALSDRIVVIHHGVKIATGSPNEISKDERVIKVYLGEGYLIA
jgi:branched-chain amino acid transport system ATP-binding protein